MITWIIKSFLRQDCIAFNQGLVRKALPCRAKRNDPWKPGTLALIACLAMLLATPTMGQIERGWFDDMRPVSGLDSPFRDGDPHLTPDGLEIYFSSDRPSEVTPVDWTLFDIWVATRNSETDPFGEPVKLNSNVNSDTLGEYAPELSHDMRSLYFFSGSGPGIGDGEIWVSERESLAAPWGEPVSVGPKVNQPGQEDVTPTVTNDGLTLIFSSSTRDGLQDAMDLFQATRTSVSDPFGDVVPLDNLNTDEFGELYPDISSNGLVLFYQSTNGPFGFPAVWVATRSSTSDEFDNPININGLGSGSTINSQSAVEFSPGISDDWPAPCSKLYYARAFTDTDWDIWEATWNVDRFSDVNLDGIEDVRDIDIISEKIRLGSNEPLFDLNSDGLLDTEDRRVWVEQRANTFFGDSNLDGSFDNLDLVAVLQAGQYLDGIDGNSTWATGDWNGDGDFDRGDIVLALQGGGYQQGFRALGVSGGSVAAVPEPTSIALLVCGIGLATVFVRRASKRDIR